MPVPQCGMSRSGMSDLATKWITLALNGTDSDIIKTRFLVNFSSPSQNVLKSRF